MLGTRVADSLKWHAMNVGGESSDWNACYGGQTDSANHHVIDYANDVKVTDMSCVPPWARDGRGCRGENGMITSTIFLIRVR